MKRRRLRRARSEYARIRRIELELEPELERTLDNASLRLVAEMFARMRARAVFAIVLSAPKKNIGAE